MRGRLLPRAGGLALLLASCVPPRPAPVLYYDAYLDRIVVANPAALALVGVQYGQAGVDWLFAHEEGHRTVVHLWRGAGFDALTFMPGDTVAVRRGRRLLGLPRRGSRTAGR